TDYERRLEFAMKFQQYTAPVQAKGVEDTAFYRYNLLLSANEVGGDLERLSVSVSDFHQANLDRQRDWPSSLLATATHDTKRAVRSRETAAGFVPRMTMIYVYLIFEIISWLTKSQMGLWRCLNLLPNVSRPMAY